MISQFPPKKAWGSYLQTIQPNHQGYLYSPKNGRNLKGTTFTPPKTGESGGLVAFSTSPPNSSNPFMRFLPMRRGRAVLALPVRSRDRTVFLCLLCWSCSYKTWSRKARSIQVLQVRPRFPSSPFCGRGRLLLQPFSCLMVAVVKKYSRSSSKENQKVT